MAGGAATAVPRSRRTLLKTVAAAGATVGLGYAGSFAASGRGRALVRHVSGHLVDGGTLRIVDIYHEELNRDGTTDRRVHDVYRGRIDEGIVSTALHRDLFDRFAAVRYYLGHDCPGCSTPAVSRREFNGVALDESVRLVYHDDGATVVPAPLRATRRRRRRPAGRRRARRWPESVFSGGSDPQTGSRGAGASARFPGSRTSHGRGGPPGTGW